MFLNKKNLIIAFSVLSIAALPLSAKSSSNSAKIVDFGRCYMESEFGKREQDNFNQMKDQMENSIKDLSDQLTEVQTKLDDEFIVDSLSPEAEKELNDKKNTLIGELQRYQMQYPQIMQNAQQQSVYAFAERVKAASKDLAKEKSYSLIMNKDQVFHYTEELDVTSDVIVRLDSMYKTENAKAANELAKKNTK